MTITFDEQGTPVVVTERGVDRPYDFSFKTINAFVNRPGVQFEELEALCLAMADSMEKLGRNEYICKKCCLRKASNHPHSHDF